MIGPGLIVRTWNPFQANWTDDVDDLHHKYDEECAHDHNQNCTQRLNSNMQDKNHDKNNLAPIHFEADLPNQKNYTFVIKSLHQNYDLYV